MKIEIRGWVIEYVAGSHSTDSLPPDYKELWAVFDDIIHCDAPLIEKWSVVVDGQEHTIPACQVLKTKKDMVAYPSTLVDHRMPISDYYDGWRNTYNDANLHLFEAINEGKGVLTYSIDSDSPFDPKRLVVLSLELLDKGLEVAHTILYHLDSGWTSVERVDSEVRGVGMSYYWDLEEL